MRRSHFKLSIVLILIARLVVAFEMPFGMLISMIRSCAPAEYNEHSGSLN